jgi:hypothetical protein
MSWMADFQSSLLPADGLGRGAAGFVALAARRGSLERGRVGLGPQADMARKPLASSAQSSYFAHRVGPIRPELWAYGPTLGLRLRSARPERSRRANFALPPPRFRSFAAAAVRCRSGPIRWRLPVSPESCHASGRRRSGLLHGEAGACRPGPGLFCTLICGGFRGGHRRYRPRCPQLIRRVGLRMIAGRARSVPSTFR